jgi:succinyl-CoA synthetase beta subunit
LLAGASIGCHPHCINLAAHTAALADMQRKLKKKVLVKIFSKIQTCDAVKEAIFSHFIPYKNARLAEKKNVPLYAMRLWATLFIG